MVQLSHPYMTAGKTIALTRQTFVGKVMSLLFHMLSRLVINFLPRSKPLLISWLQSPSAVILAILQDKKKKSLWLSSITQEKVKFAQSCPTLCDPMDCSPPGSSVHGILQARILEWVAFPFSRGSSWPKDGTQVFHIAGGFFTSWSTREAPVTQEPRSPFVCVRVEPFPFLLHLPTKLRPHLSLSGPSSLFPPSLPTSQASATFRSYLLYLHCLSGKGFIILSPHFISYSLSWQDFYLFLDTCFLFPVPQYAHIPSHLRHSSFA